MLYQFAKKQNYSAYASGSVFYSVPGHPAFPVRLASEIFLRCMAIRHTLGFNESCVLYDPCCGGAYHLSVLAHLYRDKIKRIMGSDTDRDIIEVARRNLSLSTIKGIDDRIAELSHLTERYGKASHRTALANALAMKSRMSEALKSQPLETLLFHADATDSRTFPESFKRRFAVDIIITDVPYGQQTGWASETVADEPLRGMLEVMLPLLSAGAVVAIAADKMQNISCPKYRRINRFLVGKRQVALLQPYATEEEMTQQADPVDAAARRH